MLIRRHQSGFALLIFMLVLISAYFLAASGLLTKSLQQQNKDKRAKNIQLLNQAKEALLSYSVDYMLAGNDVGDMGKLPCPDVRNVSNLSADIGGIQDASCGLKGVNSMGYFPYKTVGIGKTEDSEKECFLYVVSANYKNNPEYGLRNWDSNGFLKLVDENGVLQHGSSLVDYPIALIIAPQKNINQDRAPDPSGDLSDCRANYTLSNYLEGGPNIDYTSDLPLTADTEWTFLQASAASQLNDVDYNDQLIAIYKSELWDRVKAMKDLDTTIVPATAIKSLTQKLGVCLLNYMEESTNSNKNAVFPANLNIADYSNDSLYQDNNIGLRYGLFPQDITTSEAADSASVSVGAFVSTYCVNNPTISPVLTGAEEELWQNWKDHFFLVIGDDFMPGKTTNLVNRCTVSGKCLDINSKTSVAAIIFFAGEASNGQDRTLSAGTSNTLIWNQYMDGINQNLYVGNNATNDFTIAENDYAYCIVKSGSPTLPTTLPATLTATEC